MQGHLPMTQSYRDMLSEPMTFTLFPDSRGALAADSLAGLSVGDALGAQFFVPGVTADALPPGPWPWTDDTEEACCLVATLAEGDFDRDGLRAAVKIQNRELAAYELGCGARAMAQDTVPFALWVAARYLDDYPSAVAACLDAGGDVDTTCAIAGGVVAAYTGTAGIPPGWLAAREPLPDWLQVTH